VEKEVETVIGNTEQTSKTVHDKGTIQS